LAAEDAYRKEHGELVERGDAERLLTEAGRAYARGRESAPAKLARLLIGKTDMDEIERILRRELRGIDERIAEEVEHLPTRIFGADRVAVAG
jgi:hypothetical protein